MIIEPIKKTVSNMSFWEITHNEPYFLCGYIEGQNQILAITEDEKPMIANSITRSILTGFGATSYAELLQEIENRNLILPT